MTEIWKFLTLFSSSNSESTKKKKIYIFPASGIDQRYLTKLIDVSGLSIVAKIADPDHKKQLPAEEFKKGRDDICAADRKLWEEILRLLGEKKKKKILKKAILEQPDPEILTTGVCSTDNDWQLSLLYRVDSRLVNQWKRIFVFLFAS